MKNLILVLTILFTGILSAQSVTVSGTTFLSEGSHPSIDLTISSATISSTTYRVLAANFLNPLDSYRHMFSGVIVSDVLDLYGDEPILRFDSLSLTQTEIDRIMDRFSGTVIFYNRHGVEVHRAEIEWVTNVHMELSQESEYNSGAGDTWEIILD